MLVVITDLTTTDAKVSTFSDSSAAPTVHRTQTVTTSSIPNLSTLPKGTENSELILFNHRSMNLLYACCMHLRNDFSYRPTVILLILKNLKWKLKHFLKLCWNLGRIILFVLFKSFQRKSYFCRYSVNYIIILSR